MVSPRHDARRSATGIPYRAATRPISDQVVCAGSGAIRRAPACGTVLPLALGCRAAVQDHCSSQGAAPDRLTRCHPHRLAEAVVRPPSAPHDHTRVLQRHDRARGNAAGRHHHGLPPGLSTWRAAPWPRQLVTQRNIAAQLHDRPRGSRGAAGSTAASAPAADTPDHVREITEALAPGAKESSMRDSDPLCPVHADRCELFAAFGGEGGGP